VTEADVTTGTTDNVGRRLGSRLFWAFVGAVLVLNAFILERLVGDGGTVAQLSALSGLVILLVPMVRLVIEDMRGGRARMNELAVLAVLACASRGDLKTAGVIIRCEGVAGGSGKTVARPRQARACRRRRRTGRSGAARARRYAADPAR
jgi:hypothetical protein